MANKIKNSNIDADIVSGATLLDEGAATGDTLLIYDTSAGTLKRITQTNLLNFPTVTSVSPTNLASGDGTGNYTIVITGTVFTGATAKLINDSGSDVSFDSQTVDSATQITGVIAKSSLPGSGEPYDVRVTASSGLQATLENQINIDQQPAFSTASGSLYSGSSSSYSNVTIVAADPESGGDITYTLESGSLPAGLSGTSTSSGYVISGTPTVPGSNTTSTFTIRAADVNSNTSDRQFTITINAPVSESFTSSGTFSVPSGVSSVDVLVVAAGGGGGGTGPSDGHGGGGAGGLIYRPGFSVTPGGTVSVTVGVGGGATGGDSVFGTLTAKGGGEGGGPSDGGSGGGSGGGGGRPGSGGGANQPTQPGDSGNYGFGNSGGPGSPLAGGGGGGAGAAGSGGSDSSPSSAGNGGVGKAYTIADGSSPVYYAGGGAGSWHNGGPSGNGGAGQGGGASGNNNGTANRGGGGGGNSSQGGKGIVIVRY